MTRGVFVWLVLSTCVTAAESSRASAAARLKSLADEYESTCRAQK